MNNRPPTYNKQPHGEIRQDVDCAACELGMNRQRRNRRIDEAAARAEAEGETEKDRQKRLQEKKEFCISGAGPADLTKVKLIIVSDYPGHYECLYGYPMVNMLEKRDERNKKGLLNNLNAGALLRSIVEDVYGLDTYTECWITNAMKCNPNQVKPLDSKHLKPCAMRYLAPEFMVLDTYCPTVPILIAGTQAFRAMCLIYKTDGKTLQDLGFNSCRRRKDLKLGTHPTVVTFNPAAAARAMPRIETRLKRVRAAVVPASNSWLGEFMPLSPINKFLRDVTCLTI